MDQKAIIAIAVVAVLAVGGCAAAVMIMNDNGGSTEPLKVDSLRTDVKADDYIKYSMTGTTMYSDDQAGVTSESFLNYLFKSFSSEPTSKSIVTYKGKDIECNCYDFSGSYFYIGPNDVVYRYGYSDKDSETFSDYRLSDTNFDLSKGAASQTVSKDSFIKYTARQTQGIEPNVTSETDGTMTYSYTTYNEDTKSGNMHMVSDMKTTAYMTKTVKSISDDGKTLTMTDGSTMSKNNFLSYVSKDAQIQYLKDEGYTVTEGQKSTKTMDTEFGKRNVTVQEFKSYKSDSDNQTLTITYGDKGVTYTMTVVGTASGMSADATMTLLESSLITKG